MIPQALSWPLALLAQVLHLLLMLLAAILLPGLLRWLGARLQGRHGPPLLQPARDWLRLLRKQPVLAENASAISSIAPYAGLAAMLVAALLVPGFAHGLSLSPWADLVLLAGLLAIARGAAALAAMDAGTAAGGRFAAHAMGMASLTLPTLLLVAMGFYILTGTSNPDAAGAVLQEATTGPRVPLGLLLIALLAIALAENARLPFADPGPPAMPEASGRYLALWEMQAALRLIVWMALLVGLFVPYGMAGAGSGVAAWLLALPAWVAKLLLLTLALALAEANIARMRDARLTELLATAMLMALLGVAWLFLSTGAA
jgi:formate hydrogenlyase subunit 4